MGIVMTEPIFESLWGNLEIQIPFNFNLYSSNFLFLQDLYDEFGNPLTKLQMEARTNRPIMFNVYCVIWKAIPGIWKN